MRTISRSPERALLPLLLCLCCFGCARPIGSDDAGGKTGRPVPFRDAVETGAQTSSSSGSTLDVPPDGSGPNRGVPFHSQNLPSGTLLSVRLNEAISAEGRGQDSSFTASLDEPIVIDGRAVVARGANVTGRVESAQSSDRADGRSYLCLTLNAIEVGGRDLPVSTSTLFAKGTTTEHSGRHDKGLNVRVEQGRHLTFRLTAPLSLSTQVAMSRQ
jgi:hypothetical protein